MMMLSRRLTLIGVSAGLVFPGRRAFAQANSPPKPDDVVNAVKNMEQYRRILLAVDTLRLVLILQLLQEDPKSSSPAGDSNKYSDIKKPFESGGFRENLEAVISSSDNQKLIVTAGDLVKPTVVNIETRLEKGGVAPKGPVGSEMIVGFYKFVQMKAVADKVAVAPKDAWYCSIYPFSRFCAAT